MHRTPHSHQGFLVHGSKQGRHNLGWPLLFEVRGVFFKMAPRKYSREQAENRAKWALKHPKVAYICMQCLQYTSQHAPFPDLQTTPPLLPQGPSGPSGDQSTDAMTLDDIPHPASRGPPVHTPEEIERLNRELEPGIP